MSINYKLGLIVLFLVLWSDRVYAYVDPGFVGYLYQFVYFIIFGVLFGWLVRPIQPLKNFIKKVFQKLRGAKKHSENDIE